MKTCERNDSLLLSVKHSAAGTFLRAGKEYYLVVMCNTN